jgi:putative MATE family efflux protein
MRKPAQDIPGMFDGPIVPLVVRLSLPILASNLLQFLYAAVDTWWISRLDPSSTALLAGTGTMFPVFFLIMAIGGSIAVGVSALVGRVIGERNEVLGQHVMPSAIVLVMAIVVPVLVAGYGWGGGLVRLLAGDQLSAEAMGYGLSYFHYLLPGMAMMLCGQAFFGVLQGEGRTPAIAHAAFLSTFVNMALDPLCMFWLKMGVAGAGLATSISIVVALVYVTVLFVRGHTHMPFSLDPRRSSATVVFEIARIGLPQFLSMSSLALGFLFLNKLVGSISEGAMNAWALAGRMDQLVLIPSFAVAGATVPMMAQNYGRGLIDRVRMVFVRNVLLAIGAVAVAALAYNLGARWLFGMFSDVPDVVEAAVRQVRMLSFTFMGVSAVIVSASAFQATGRPLPALAVNLLRMAALAVPLAYLLVNAFGLGMTGVYTGIATANIGAAGLTLVWVMNHLRGLTYRTVASDSDSAVPDLEPDRSRPL